MDFGRALGPLKGDGHVALSMKQVASKTFRLSDRLSICITMVDAGLAVEWDPAIPKRLSKRELHAYRAARSEMVASLAEIFSGAVIVVETGA